QQQLDDYVAGQGREAAERLAQVAQSLQDSLAGLQQAMAQEVLQLACDIARQVVRREVAGNPRAMLPVVREALGMLAAESRPATVRLHPDDWAALEKPLREEFASPRIEWQADAAVQPGDCVVESAGMQIDGTLDKRWRRAIAALGLTAAWREDGHAD
ncbi:MAG TPA: flagellar assembly protein FliH, partial [Alicycliphilus sp.]|nr:flagellar assembly protein FliH [Alicycliphilus sp.]